VAAGACYVVFGKGIENVLILPVIGAASGALVGTIAAWWRR
jgi:hypothetical protein